MDAIFDGPIGPFGHFDNMFKSIRRPLQEENTRLYYEFRATGKPNFVQVIENNLLIDRSLPAELAVNAYLCDIANKRLGIEAIEHVRELSAELISEEKRIEMINALEHIMNSN